MTFIFWGAVITMVIAAVLFLALPIFQTKVARPALVFAIIAFVPAVGFGLYVLVGSPGSVSAESQVEHNASGPSRTRSSDSVASLIGGLKSRLEQDPKDAGGWLLLAQSYRHLGDETNAANAYQRVRALGKTDPQFEVSNSTALTSRPMSDKDFAARIHGQVVIAPELADRIRPDDTIFIFAKESKAHRMPVAAIRRPAATLPIEFELTNDDVMIAGTDLADYKSLLVTARVSRSGLATDTETGWQVWSSPIAPLDNGDVELIIAAGSESGPSSDE